MAEYMDVYNENRQPTGAVVDREDAFMHEGEYLLYVLAIVQDTQGRFLITRRSLDKHWAAGWWEISGGGARSGETSEVAVRREVLEEVGLDTTGIEPELVYQYKNEDLARGDNYIVDIYRLHLDFTAQDVVLQAEEAIDCRLVTWDEIVALNEEGIFLHFNRVKLALGMP